MPVQPRWSGGWWFPLVPIDQAQPLVPRLVDFVDGLGSQGPEQEAEQEAV